jgi:hypothetical protein
METCDLPKKIAIQLYGECELALSQAREQVEARLQAEESIDKQKVLTHLVRLMAVVDSEQCKSR